MLSCLFVLLYFLKRDRDKWSRSCFWSVNKRTNVIKIGLIVSEKYKKYKRDRGYIYFTPSLSNSTCVTRARRVCHACALVSELNDVSSLISLTQLEGVTELLTIHLYR